LHRNQNPLVYALSPASPLVAQDNKVKVLTGQGGEWTVQDTQGPEGQVTDAVLMPDHKLYLIAGTSLWQTTLS